MAVYPERRAGGLSGKWIAEVTHHGDRLRKRFDSKHEADRWADTTKLTGRAPAPSEVCRQTHTFGAVAQEALQSHAGWTAGRDPSRAQRLTYVTQVFGADTPIEAVRAVALDRLVNTLKRRPGNAAKTLNPGTINRYLSVASAVLTYARKREYIEGAPVVPWQVEAGRRIHWLTNEAEKAVGEALVAQGRQAEELVMRVLAATGLRWSEFASLEPAQVIDGWIKLTDTKTDTPRDVPIATLLAAELLELLRRPEGLPGYQTFRKCLKRALKTAGQSEDLTPHCLRHTTATRLVIADVNLAVVKDFMGHSSINTTLKYTHVTKRLLQEALTKVSAT